MASLPISVLSVRVNAEERALLEAGEFGSLARSTVTLPTESWEAFEAWAKGLARDKPELDALKPVWEA